MNTKKKKKKNVRPRAPKALRNSRYHLVQEPNFTKKEMEQGRTECLVEKLPALGGGVWQGLLPVP